MVHPWGMFGKVLHLEKEFAYSVIYGLFFIHLTLPERISMLLMDVIPSKIYMNQQKLVHSIQVQCQI